MIEEILAEGKDLDDLARHPSMAARTGLYAGVAAWIADHPDPRPKDDIRFILESPRQAAVTDTRSLGRECTWQPHAATCRRRYVRMETDSPLHLSDLLRSAIVDELFGFEPFGRILGDLKAQIAFAFDGIAKCRTTLVDPAETALPKGCNNLGVTLRRLDSAIRFARWRHENDAFAREIATSGPPRNAFPSEEPAEKTTLTGKLLDLDADGESRQACLGCACPVWPAPATSEKCVALLKDGLAHTPSQVQRWKTLPIWGNLQTNK